MLSCCTRQSQRFTIRSGISLTESITAIIVVAILAAMLIPAVGSGPITSPVRNLLEVSSIAQAFERYRLEYGVYPPDFAEVALEMTTTGDENAAANIAVAIINAHVGKAYPYRVAVPNVQGATEKPLDLPFDETGNIDTKLLASLSPKNAIHFWLRGRTENSRQPIFGTESLQHEARQPFFEFDKLRLRNALSHASEYYSRSNTNRKAIVYYKSDTNSSGSEYEPALQLACADRSYPTPYAIQDSSETRYAATNSFQIICAGMDGQFHDPAVPLTSPTVIKRNQRSTFYTDNNRRLQSDNITNFTNGTLADFIERKNSDK